MSEFLAGDHAMGLELQLEELVEQRRRLQSQGWPQAAQCLTYEIADLIDELAATAERAIVY